MNSAPATPAMAPFHVMAKPSGPLCNLDCRYCFYVGKMDEYEDGHSFRMSDEVLETYIRDYCQHHPGPEVPFAWQGGEPTLVGIDFFKRVIALQTEHCPAGKTCTNAIQTNGTRIDDEWCEFLARERFLVGLSIDGPAELHDAYRVDRGGKPTHARVMQTVDQFHRHSVAFNTLTVVNRRNVSHALDVYRFLKRIGSGFMQFIPLVERAADGKGRNHAISGPPIAGHSPDPITRWSVPASDFGEFLVELFDEWVRKDIGQTYVQLFDVMLGAWHHGRASLCVFSETCGNAVVLEHDGSLYACDHFVYPEYRLGSITETSLAELTFAPDQIRFGRDKRDTLPDQCQTCSYRFACHGACPKHRFAQTPSGQPGLNYLCPAYLRFFRHADPYLRRMSQLLHQHQPPALLMQEIHQAEVARFAGAGPNQPCPCGSGKKFKRCHGRHQAR